MTDGPERQRTHSWSNPVGRPTAAGDPRDAGNRTAPAEATPTDRTGRLLPHATSTCLLTRPATHPRDLDLPLTRPATR